MPSNQLNHLCITPQPEHVGGPASFVGRLSAALAKRGLRLYHDLDAEAIQSALLIGATRNLVAVRQAQRREVRIVQRLDGINWLHRRLPTGPRHWLKAQLSNVLLAYTRERFAAHVVYQSQFVVDWWRENYGAGPPYSVIHNGVDLEHFNPAGDEHPPEDRIRLLMVEGRLGGGYEIGLRHGLAMAQTLAEKLGRRVELAVAAEVDERERARHQPQGQVEVNWLGLVGQAELPALYRSAQMLFSGDINPACPNSVIEALACGTPVLAFATGSLPELVTHQAGHLADYGGDPWKLDPPDIGGLAGAAETILANQAQLRAGARARAEAAFGLDQMVDRYLDVLTPDG